MVETYLKVFTFLTPEEIMDIVSQHKEHPELRIGQKSLAKEIITDLHGAEEFEKAVKTSENLFSGNIKDMDIKDLLVGLKDVPHFDIEECPLIDLLVNNGVASSRREAREFLSGNAISINGDIVTDENMMITKDNSLDGVVIIRRGKKKYFVASFK